MASDDTITIDLCGRLADAAGPTLTIACAGPQPVVVVVERLGRDHPALGAALATMPVRFAIDEVLADNDALIAPGARLALFPPVSGG